MGHETCCVVNCKNNGKNSDCKFYKFPQASWKRDQRMMWIIAVNRKNADGSLWYPKPHDKICSAHFIGGKRADEQDSSSYIPRLFPVTHTTRVNANLAVSRYKRYIERNRKKGNKINDKLYQQTTAPPTDPVQIPTVVTTPEVKAKRATTCSSIKDTEKPREDISQQYPGENVDKFYKFGNIVAKRLCNLPLDLALESEELILAVLRKQHLKALKVHKKTCNSSSATSSDTHDLECLQQSETLNVAIKEEPVQERIQDLIKLRDLQNHLAIEAIIDNVKIEKVDEDPF